MTTLLAPKRTQSLALSGLATGAAAQFVVFFVYQLIRIGFRIAENRTLPAGSTVLPVRDTPDRIFGVYVIGGLLSLAPAIVAGVLTGAILGTLLDSTWRRQGPLRAWLTGSVLAYVIALLVNTVVLVRQRKVPMSYEHWAQLVGYPSVIFVILFGIIGLWLYLSRSWTISE
jgi:hypothetical protein